MKTKIVYSLVSDAKDHFLEQLLISTYSIKLHNKDAHIVLVIDEESNKELTDDRQKALVYVDEKIVVKTPELSKKSRSRWLKTSIRQIVQGDYLFIDTDTIITCDLSEIDDIDGKICAVLDRHLPLDKNQRGETIIKQCKRSGWTPETQDYKYFNSGVMLVRDCQEARALYQEWHNIWENSYQRGIDIDQPALGLANRQTGYQIRELCGVWNCQVLGNGLRYMYDAKILHYYNSDSRSILHSNPFVFSNIQFQHQIKEAGYQLTREIKEMITSPLRQFATSYEIIADERLEAFTSQVGSFIMRGYKQKSILYRLLNLYVRAVIAVKDFVKSHK
ncbi:MAG: hypothetical protein IJ710_03270 [Prevotella sp.]|nr:hypothetical protein [Prevotella sp.]